MKRVAYTQAIVALMLGASIHPAASQALCVQKCPGHAPMFHSKSMMCLERSVPSIGFEDVVLAGFDGLSGLAQEVFGSLKDSIVQYASADPDGPDCNWAAQLFPDKALDNTTHSECKATLDAIKADLEKSPPVANKAQANFVIFCRGNFQFGGFPFDAYEDALN